MMKRVNPKIVLGWDNNDLEQKNKWTSSTKCSEKNFTKQKLYGNRNEGRNGMYFECKINIKAEEIVNIEHFKYIVVWTIYNKKITTEDKEI